MSDLPKIAVQWLGQRSATEVHPDPNLIGAFVENALPQSTRAQILEHIAQCADCREVVFLSTPDQAATMPTVVSAPSTWLNWPVLRWGAAVAAVVVVVAAVSLHRPSGAKFSPTNAIQQTDVPSAKEKAAPASLQEEKHDMAVMAKPAPIPPIVTDGAADTEGRRSDQLKKQSSRVAAMPTLAQKSEVAAGKLADERRDELDKTQVAGVARAQAPVESATAETAQPVPGRAKDAATEAASNMSAGMGGGIAPHAAPAFQHRPAIFSPMGAPRWTLTSDGTLQRSVDFGRSWQTVQVASQASFRALAASGKDIWVGGAKGALYHSADAGQNWTEVHPVASGQQLVDDIIGVEFPDSMHGKLTTTSKETWTTEDGGQTWGRQ